MKKNLEVIKMLDQLVKEDVISIDILTKYAEKIDELYSNQELPENPWNNPIYPTFPVYPTCPANPWNPLEIWY